MRKSFMGRTNNSRDGRSHGLRSHWILPCAAVVILSGLVVAPVNASAASPPKAPQQVTLGAVSVTTIQISWKDVSNNESGFQISDGQATKTIAAGSRNYRWAGLQPNERACLMVRAVNNRAGASAWVPKASGTLCARTPTLAEENFLAFPLTSRTRAKSGGYGLHDDQYKSLPGYKLEKKSRDKNYALDFVPQDAADHPEHQQRVDYSVLSMEDGTVKIVWPDCDAIVVEAGTIPGSCTSTFTLNPSCSLTNKWTLAPS